MSETMNDDAVRAMLAEIKDGLEGVSSGTWATMTGLVVTVYGPSTMTVAKVPCDIDAAHIARCADPKTVRAILAYVEKIERERDEAREDRARLHTEKLKHFVACVDLGNAARAQKEIYESSLASKDEEIARLREDRDIASATINQIATDIARLNGEMERVRADIARKDAALGEIIKSDTHLVWTGGAVPEPSHEEFGTCAEIALSALSPSPPEATSPRRRGRDEHV